MPQVALSAEKTSPDPVPDRLKASVNRSAEAAVELYLTLLQDLALMGVGLARREIERAEDDPRAGSAAGLMLDRVSRMVRRNAALDARLREDVVARSKAAEAERAERAQAETCTQATEPSRADFGATEVKVIVHEVVMQTLKDHAPRERIERLVCDLREKLADPDEDLDFEDAPVSALIGRVCKALGVAPDWDLWEDEDWALEEAENWTAGSPYPLWRRAAKDAEEDGAEAEAGGP